MAAQEGQEETARLLLRHGAPAGATDRAGWSAFHYAANHRWATWSDGVDGQLAVLRMLVEHGADVDASDGEGYTCVHSAAQSGKVEMLRVLRNLGAKPDAVTVRGVAPVHVAAEGGRAAVVAELLDWCPAAAECEDVRGHRPLHHAAYHGHANVVETLLRRGADACPRGDRGASRKRGHAGDGNADGGADGSRQRDALAGGRGGVGCATTPLHLAARSGSLDAVVVLLAGGADPTRVDSRGWTPRRLAAECAAREAKTRGSGSAANEASNASNAANDRSNAASDRWNRSVANRAAVDAALERAEAGTPLLWSRAAHRLFPERFRRDARDVIRASWGATRRLRGLAADLVHDEVLRASARSVWPKEISPAAWRAVERVRAAVEAKWRDVEARSGRLARGVGLGMGLEFGGLEPFHAGGRYGRLGAFEAFGTGYPYAKGAEDAVAETATSPGEDSRPGAGAHPARARATSAQCAARREMLNAPAPGTPPGSAGPGCADGSVADDDAMETGDDDADGEDEDEVQSAPPTAHQTAAAEREAERRHAEAQQHAAMQRELFTMYETQMHLAAALAAQ